MVMVSYKQIRDVKRSIKGLAEATKMHASVVVGMLADPCVPFLNLAGQARHPVRVYYKEVMVDISKGCSQLLAECGAITACVNYMMASVEDMTFHGPGTRLDCTMPVGIPIENVMLLASDVIAMKNKAGGYASTMELLASDIVSSVKKLDPVRIVRVLNSCQDIAHHVAEIESVLSGTILKWQLASMTNDIASDADGVDDDGEDAPFT